MFSRREFGAGMIGASARVVLGGEADLQKTPERSFQERDEFPAGDYTPFGYLDNPFHTWDLNPSGVIRSVPAIGFGFYYPAGPGGYFDYRTNGIYSAFLRIGFVIDGARFLNSEDFEPRQLTAQHHSKNLFEFWFTAKGVHVECAFLQVNEDSLGARLKVQGTAKQVEVIALATYQLGGASWWGRDGLAGNYEASADAVSIHSFAAGTIFTVKADRASAAHYIGKRQQDVESRIKKHQNTSAALSYHPDPLHGALLYEVQLQPDSPAEMNIVLSRTVNRAAAVDAARASLSSAGVQIARKRAEDEVFWKRAPRLEGDWPAHWKHGWVYDFETLRMMVRKPIGVYRHAWDAMQIQAPRNVLAETSIDMWALSYADPNTAKAVFAGQFADAIEPNVPCMRESGVMNMVAADGSECGTSISWCFPYFVAASIYDRTGDAEWLRAVYPGLARLLRWTLANRRDAGGFLVGKCSWETGMDASKRFLIQQPTGGELTEFVRLVELQAAASHAGSVLARFAAKVDDSVSVLEWQNVQRIFAEKTQELWKQDWFFDFDTRSAKLVTTVGRDPAQSAPAFCGIASADQMHAMVATLRNLFDASKARREQPAAGWDDGLAWSSLMLPYLESIWATGESELAAEVVETVAERIYASMDRHSMEAEGGAESKHKLGWPGVSCEIWGAHGAFGGEGYGWGAVMPAHIIRNLVGFRETETPGRVRMCPSLSTSLAKTGKSYSIRGLNYAADRLDVTLTVLDHGRVRVEGRWREHLRTTRVALSHGAMPESVGTGQTWQFSAPNFSRCLLYVE